MRSGGHGRVMWALLKNYGFTTGHHFNKCRELNIKNPLFTLMADFCVFWGKVWCEARDVCSFKMAVEMARFGATGGASKARMP